MICCDRVEPVEPGQLYVIDTFKPEDAPGIVNLFRTVYGDGYPVKLIYDPESIINAFNARENIPVVVRTQRGDIIGYESLYRSSPNPSVYEAGQGLVLPSYRKLGIVDEINRYVCENMAPEMNIDAVFGEAVCNHIYMQKSWYKYADIITALEVDLMPSEAYSKEHSASGRVATIFMFRLYQLIAHTVYLPAVYEYELKFIYRQLNDKRTLIISKEMPDKGLFTNIKTQVFDFAKVARLAVHEAGEDFSEVFERQEKNILEQGMIVIQVWLNLSWPWVGNIAEYLRSRGYFFGGPLPGWFGSDGFLMQKIMGKPNWDGIVLYNENQMEILKIVKDDWLKGQTPQRGVEH